MTLYTDVTSKHFKLKEQFPKFYYLLSHFELCFQSDVLFRYISIGRLLRIKIIQTNIFTTKIQNDGRTPRSIALSVLLYFSLCEICTNSLMWIVCHCQILPAILSDVYQFVNWYSKYHFYGRSSSFCLKIQKNIVICCKRTCILHSLLKFQWRSTAVFVAMHDSTITTNDIF